MATTTDSSPVFLDALLATGMPTELTTSERKSEIEQLLDQLEAQEAEERELLKEYERAAETTPDKGVRFLMGLVLEDEQRHRRLMELMTNDVRQSVLWLHDRPALPSVEGSDERRAALLEQTEKFLAVERQSLAELANLQHRVSKIHSGLLEILVSSMAADNRKHVEILEYVKRQLSKS